MKKDITLIMAYGPDGVLGNHGALPWPHHAEDMKRFKAETIGGSLIMGRKTFDSLKQPLKFRQNIVVSRNHKKLDYGPTVAIAKDLPSAITMAEHTKIYVIGGAELFSLAMPYATRILLTEMHGQFEGDVYFKIPFLHQWKEISREAWRGEGGDCDFVEYILE
jgi:dihydrofolate reductase